MVDFDTHGHLKDVHAWSALVCNDLCILEGLSYSAEILKAAEIVRDFSSSYQLDPSIILLGNYIRKKHSQISSPGLWLSCLFPNDTLRQLTRVAGLPLPKSCLARSDF